MSRYAFMVHAPGESPATYSKVYETPESYELYAGVSDMNMGAELMKQLSEEGFEMVDLCGAFDDETVKKFIEIGQGKIEVSAARYSPEELAKLEKLPALKEFGFLSFMPSVNEIERVDLLSKNCNTYIRFVRDMEMACQAAAELVEAGIDMIELCSWFDSAKTQTIIDAIQGKAPIGSCGQTGK